MSDKYLISSLVNGIENYYTASSDGSIKNIGGYRDWTQGFDENILNSIDNTVYSTLDNAKVYVNSTSHKTASVETTGEGLLWTSESTNISTAKYSIINKITATGDSGVRYAISFNGTNSYKTRGIGLIPNTKVAVPSTENDRTTAGVKINTTNTDIANAFDGNESTVYTINDGDSRYVEIEFTNPTRLLRHIIKLNSDSRMPVVAKFQGYNDTKLIWETLDEITILTDRSIDRTFENKENRYLYRWYLGIDANAIGDDPKLKTAITELNAYGSIQGETWLDCKPAEVATKGMTASKLAAISSTQYTDIFQQGNLDIIAYIPSGNTFTRYDVEFPANSAPIIKDFVPSANEFHAEDINIRFTITDPEGTKCKYKIYVNGKLFPNKNADWTDVTDANGICTATITNNYFDTVPGKNIIKIEAIDEDGVTSSKTYDLIKNDELPESLNGIMFEDTYTFTIIDKDAPDKIKYEAYIINDKHKIDKNNPNGKKIAEETYQDNPKVGNVVNIPPDDVVYGKNNTLRLILTDSVGGVSVFDIVFVGDYFGLLFSDTDPTKIKAPDNLGNHLFSSDIGKIIKKLDFGNVTGGMLSDPPMKVYVYNKSSKQLKGVTIETPSDGIDGGYANTWEQIKDANGNYIYFDRYGNETTKVTKAYGGYYSDENGSPVKANAKVAYDKGHAGCKTHLIRKHIMGSTFAELSKDDSFVNKNSYFSLNIGDMASYEVKEFFMRIDATSYAIRIANPDFVTSGSANYSV